MTINAQATQIKIAVHNRNRTTIDYIDKRFNLKRLVRALITRRLLTNAQAISALQLRSNISNASCSAIY
jgi:hypothetical protein